MESKRPNSTSKETGNGSSRRLAIAAVVGVALMTAAAMTGGGIGGLRDTAAAAVSRVTDTVREAASEALSAKGSTSSGTGTPSDDPATLAVTATGSMNGYARARFGQPWTDDVDVDGGHNHCDTRNDILARDLTSVDTFDGCKVLSGTLVDPYTGAVIAFTRGKDTSALVQIDHIVPLGNAWVSGASSWKLPQLKRIANDPLNLLAVDGASNAAKRDYSADKWLPANAAFRCTYVKRQVMVKNKYGLSVTAAEKAVMDSYNGRC